MAVPNPDEVGEDSTSAPKDAPFTKPVGKLKLNATTNDGNSAAAETDNGNTVDGGGDPASNLDADGAENNEDHMANSNDPNPTSPTLLKKNRAMAAAAAANRTSAGDADATGDGDGGGAMISPESINGQA